MNHIPPFPQTGISVFTQTKKLSLITRSKQLNSHAATENRTNAHAVKQIR